MDLINENLSIAVQLVLFSGIPFVFYSLSKKKENSFFRYIGLYSADKRSIKLAFLASILFLISATILTLFNEDIKEIMVNPPSVTGQLRLSKFSFSGVLSLLLIALLKTALAEEILFRGFIGKQSIKKFGVKVGNIFQALIFGAVHVLLFWSLTKASFLFLFLVFVFTFIAGWIIGLINEKYGNGSIFPGWIAHGLGNVLAYLIIVYLI